MQTAKFSFLKTFRQNIKIKIGIITLPLKEQYEKIYRKSYKKH